MVTFKLHLHGTLVQWRSCLYSGQPRWIQPQAAQHGAVITIKNKLKTKQNPKLTLSFQAVREGAAELLNMVHCLPHSGQHSRLASRCPVTSRSVAQTKFYSPRPELERTARFYKQTADCPCDQRTPGRKSYLCAVCVKKVDPLRRNGRQTGWLCQRNLVRRAEEQRY